MFPRFLSFTTVRRRTSRILLIREPFGHLDISDPTQDENHSQDFPLRISTWLIGPDWAPQAIDLGSAIRQAGRLRWFWLVNYAGSLGPIWWSVEPGWLLVTYRRMKELRGRSLMLSVCNCLSDWRRSVSKGLCSGAHRILMSPRRGRDSGSF